MKKKYTTLSALLTPDYMFESYAEVTPEFLASIGIKALLIDIDNTLAPYEQTQPNEANIAWLDSLNANGIKTALISNNRRARVEMFSKTLGIDAYANSKKPFSPTLIAAMKKMDVTPDITAGLGDQLITDTLAAHRLGMVSIIVPPIKDKTSPFFKAKRSIERPYIKKYRKANGIEVKQGSLSERTWKK